MSFYLTYNKIHNRSMLRATYNIKISKTLRQKKINNNENNNNKKYI